MTAEDVRLSPAAVAELRRQTAEECRRLFWGYVTAVSTTAATVAAIVSGAAGYFLTRVAYGDAHLEASARFSEQYADALAGYSEQMAAAVREVGKAEADAQGALKTTATAAAELATRRDQTKELMAEVSTLRDQYERERNELRSLLQREGVVEEIAKILATDETLRSAVVAAADGRLAETEKRLNSLDPQYKSLSSRVAETSTELARLKRGESSFTRLRLDTDGSSETIVTASGGMLVFDNSGLAEPYGGWSIRFTSDAQRPHAGISFSHKKGPNGDGAFAFVVPAEGTFTLQEAVDVRQELAQIRGGTVPLSKIILNTDGESPTTITATKGKLFFQSDSKLPEGGWKMSFNAAPDEPRPRMSFYHRNAPAGFENAWAWFAPRAGQRE